MRVEKIYFYRSEKWRYEFYRGKRGDEDGGIILVQGGRSWRKREGEGNGGWLQGVFGEEGKRESMHRD